MAILRSLLWAPCFHSQTHFSPVTVQAAEICQPEGQVLWSAHCFFSNHWTPWWVQQLTGEGSCMCLQSLDSTTWPVIRTQWCLCMGTVSSLSGTGLHTKFFTMSSQTLRLFHSCRTHQVTSQLFPSGIISGLWPWAAASWPKNQQANQFADILHPP